MVRFMCYFFLVSICTLFHSAICLCFFFFYFIHTRNIRDQAKSRNENGTRKQSTIFFFGIHDHKQTSTKRICELLCCSHSVFCAFFSFFFLVKLQCNTTTMMMMMNNEIRYAYTWYAYSLLMPLLLLLLFIFI